MERQEVFNAWIEKTSQIDVRENFTDQVMKRIYQYEQKKRKSLFDYQRLVELISVHWPAQAALVAAGAVVGFVRVVFMIAVILGY